MRILLGNDDGYRALGLLALQQELSREHEVLVSAPDRECSATGHGLTLREPMRVQRHQNNGVLFHGVGGLPADALKFGLSVLCADRQPDLVIAGINHGANTGQNLFYSGTVGAASEGCFRGIPSMAVSLAGRHAADFAPERFATAARITLDLVRRFAEHPFDGDTLLNVNIPPLPAEEIKGYRVSRMGYARFHDRFEERSDPGGRSYFWMNGAKNGDDPEEDTDDYQVHAGWVTLSPLKLDLSHPRWRDLLGSWQLEENKPA